MSVICHRCATAKENIASRCESCGEEPQTKNGVPVLAADLIDADDGFDKETFARLSQVEMSSFWFRSRSALILSIARRHFEDIAAIAEIGCGNGAVLSDIAKQYPSAQITGMDAHTEALLEAQSRIDRTARLFQGDARHLPFVDEFDLLGAFDVIEHIVEDTDALRSINRALKPGAGLLITVPQHMMLWSASDEFSHHVRRYEKNELISKVENANFEVLDTVSFVSLLFPALLTQRLLAKRQTISKPQTTSLKPPFGINKIFGAAMWLERMMIRSGIRFPFGGSLLLVARKVRN